jgi:hypothetical protein
MSAAIAQLSESERARLLASIRSLRSALERISEGDEHR